MAKNTWVLNKTGRIIMVLILGLFISLVYGHISNIFILQKSGAEAEAEIKEYIPEHSRHSTTHYHILEYNGITVKSELNRHYRTGDKIPVIYDRKDLNKLIIGVKKSDFLRLYLQNSTLWDSIFVLMILWMTFWILFAPSQVGGKWKPFWKADPEENGALPQQLRIMFALFFLIAGFIVPIFWMQIGPDLVRLLAGTKRHIIINSGADTAYILLFMALVYPAVFFVFIKIKTGRPLIETEKTAENKSGEKKQKKPGRKKKFRFNPLWAYFPIVFCFIVWSLLQYYELGQNGIVKHNFPGKSRSYSWNDIVSIKAKATGYFETNKNPDFRFTVSFIDGKEKEMLSSKLSGVPDDKKLFEYFITICEGVEKHGKNNIKFDLTPQGYKYLEDISGNRMWMFGDKIRI